MNILVVLLIVFVLLALFGNPLLGTHVYSGYSHGYWPSGLGIVLFIVVLVILLRGGL